MLTGLSAQIEELAVDGIMTGDKDKIRRAIYMDPLTSAVCSLEEIKSMVNEMFEANAEYWHPLDGTGVPLCDGWDTDG